MPGPNNYDINVDTNYNKTVDTLRIDTAALFQDAVFNTIGPEGSYVLDFVWDIFLHAYAGVDGIGDVNLGTIDEDGTYNLLNIDSDSLAGTIDLVGGLSFNYDWPDVVVNGSLPPNPGSASDTSDNFVELNLDLDTLVANLLGIPNIFDPPSVSILGVDFDLTFIDADVFGGLNLMQEFALFMGDLKGTLTFEDGSVQAFTLGDSIQLPNASEIDANTLDPGGPDGVVDFVFTLTPDADLTNDTSVNVNIGFHLELLSLYIDAGILGDTTLGPAFEDTWDADVANIPVYSDTFNLAFSTGNYAFAA